MSARVEIIGLPGMPEVRTGDDLPGLLLDAVTAAGEGLREGDLLVVSSKVAAKAAGLEADSSDKAAVVAAQTVSVVAERGDRRGSDPRGPLVGRTGPGRRGRRRLKHRGP